MFGVFSEGGRYFNSRLYTSREYDSEIGVYYMRARYYDPSIGRFMSRDPIDIVDDINLYSYVGNNPVVWVDLMGREKESFLPNDNATDRFFEYVEMGKMYNYSIMAKAEIQLKIRFTDITLVKASLPTVSDTLPLYLYDHRPWGEFDIKRNKYFLQEKYYNNKIITNQSVKINGEEFMTSELGNFFVGLNGQRSGLSLNEVKNYGWTVEGYKFIKGGSYGSSTLKAQKKDELGDQKFYEAGYSYGEIEKSGGYDVIGLQDAAIKLLLNAQR